MPPDEPAPPARPRPAGPHAVLRWQGNADLDFEIWDATGQEYLRDAAGETAAADAPGGNDREEILDLSAISETAAVIAIGVWDFGGDADAPAELEVAADSAPRIFRATLTPERNLWKVFRWDCAGGEIAPTEALEKRILE